jgi:hypothetical protein
VGAAAEGLMYIKAPTETAMDNALSIFKQAHHAYRQPFSGT